MTLYPARTVELTMSRGDLGGNPALMSLTLAFPEGEITPGGIGGGTYPDAPGTDLPNANLYLHIDGQELGSIFFHRTADGRITATLGRYEEAASDWEPRESLPETSWRSATDAEVRALLSDEELPGHILESREVDGAWEVRV